MKKFIGFRFSVFSKKAILTTDSCALTPVKMTDRDKAQLYRELATLSEAGFPVTKAAEAALDSPRGATERAFLSELKAGVEAGGKISEAAAGASEGLSALEISIIEAAESGGRVPEGFAHLARYFDLRAAAAKKVRAGLIYPAVLLHLAVLRDQGRPRH